MSFFSKKKKSAEKENPAATMVQATIQDVQDTASTNVALTNARISQDEINAAFSRMCNDDTLYVKMKEVAVKNDKIVSEINDAAEGENDNIEHQEDIQKFLKIEEGLYITSEEIDKYAIGLRNLSRQFAEKSSVDAVKTGADRINVHTMRFINSLDDALRSGKKLKAQCCFDVLLYILNVGYRVEDINDPQALEERIKEKINIIEVDCDQLINTVDGYYQDIVGYNESERNYGELYEEITKYSERINEIPDDVVAQIDALGFAESTRSFPADGEIIKVYLPVLVSLAEKISHVKQMALQVESNLVEMIILRSNIQEILYDFRIACETSGPKFNYDEHHRRMMERRKKNVDMINRRNDMNAASLRMNQEMLSMLAEAESHIGMQNAMSDIMKTIRANNKQVRQNEKLAKEIAEKREVNAIQKQELEQQLAKANEVVEELMEEAAEEIMNDDIM